MKRDKKFTEENLKNDELVSRIKRYYRQAENAKSPLISKWKENYEAYTGEGLKRTNGNQYLGDAKINHIFSTVETVKPIMLTNMPKPIILPTKEEGFYKSQLIQEALDYEWDRTRLVPKLMDSITQGLIFGTFIVGLFWNGKSSKGQGEIEPVVISPFNFFIDPMATNIEDAEYCIYATYKPVGMLMKAYPDKAEELREQATSTMQDELTFNKETGDIRNQVLYLECYFRDYSFDESIEEDEEGNKYKIKKMRYPKGRRTILGGDIVLSDEENPYDDGQFPFVSWRCYSVPNNFWGMSEVEQLIAPQKEINNLYNSLLDNAKLNANPWTLVDKDSGVDTSTITNAPGLLLKKNRGSDIRREAPPSMPSYLQTVANDLKYDIQVISGVFDATRGERPMSVTSGTAIQALQESSQGRIRLKIQALEKLLEDLGNMWFKRMQQFWTLPRQIRVMGGHAEPDTVPIKIDGQNVVFKTVTRDVIDGDFDVKIKSGSTMPVNKSARFDIIMRLAQTPAEDGLPVLDRRTIIEYADLDNAEDIITRFEEEKLRQAEQKMQMAEMEQNNAQVQMAIQQTQAEKNFMMNQQAQMEAKRLDIEGKLALEKEKSDLQANVKEIDLDNMTVEDFIIYIQQLDDKELNELIKKQPDVLKMIRIVQELSGQSEETLQEEKE